MTAGFTEAQTCIESQSRSCYHSKSGVTHARESQMGADGETLVALASLFSVELEFLAMADQANCTFVGVASSRWYICGRGTRVIQSNTPLPLVHSTVPFHRSTPPNHSYSHCRVHNSCHVMYLNVCKHH